ncbi:hypothetical protein P5F75_10000 [Caldifermentibacillus hisashii]|jgi:hypothetical protein|nr:hypothetical protein [Caldifermentibacillus hisashii]
MKKIILVPLFILIVLIIIICLMMGVEYLASLLLNFEFVNFYGPIILSLNVLAGFLLLIPFSILLEAIVNYTGFNKYGGNFIVHLIQLSLFIFYMEFTIPRMDIVQFYSDTEIILYIIMYFTFLGIAKIGELIKKDDEQSLNNNK